MRASVALRAVVFHLAVRAGVALSACVFQLAVRAGVALLAVALHLPMGAGVALRAVLFHPAVRTGAAHRAEAFYLAVGAGVALRAVAFHLAVRTRVALRAVAFQLAVRAPFALCALVFQFARGQGLHSAQWRLSFPWGKGCTPYNFSSPSHVSTVSLPSRLVSHGIAAEIPSPAACGYRIVATTHRGCVGSLESSVAPCTKLWFMVYFSV